MKQAAEKLLAAIQHLEQATSRDRVVPIKTESLKEILEAAEALRVEMKKHCTACGTIEIEWKPCGDGAGIPEQVLDYCAIIGLDKHGNQYAFEYIQQLRASVNVTGMEWYAIIPWPKSPLRAEEHHE